MKRLLYLATLSLAATLLLATAAVAQGVPPGGGSGAYGCPADAPFPASAPNDPGEASLLCFPTQEQANLYSQTGDAGEESPQPTASPQPSASPEPTASPEPAASPEASASPEATSVPPGETGSLPDTGGPGFLLPVAGLLLAAGLVALKVGRR